MKAASDGISLLELTVSASILGLLFMGGMQFLSDLLMVQARWGNHTAPLSMTSTLLETRLQAMLAPSQNPVVSQQDKALKVDINGQSETLSFIKTATHWELHQAQQVLGQWPLSKSQTEPTFSLPASNLLRVEWPQQQAPLLIWLKNQE